ncbi:MAG: hypothetical protein GX605_02985 [Chloroflexi bacterium]|nr:hypothetical protein [Chloroflexota bacterium]
MKTSLVHWIHKAGAALVVLALLLPGAAWAQEAVSVQLDSVGGSGVSGTATLTAAGDGTEVALEVQGLAASAEAQAALHAGTCQMPSASFTALPALQADADGRATASGAVLFRGAEPVALTTLADGEHIIIVSTDQAAACGVIPALAAAAAPATLPVTGGAAVPLAAWALGLGAVSAGWLIRRWGR